MHIFCTQKFLTELRLKKAEVHDFDHSDHPLDNWYAHLFFLYPRRKCAIFMHAKTKFCFVVYDRNRQQLNDIGAVFCKGLGRALFDEHYPEAVIKAFNKRLENIEICLSRDRSVLSYINQRIQEFKWIANGDPYDGRVRDEGIAGLSLRRNPLSGEKYRVAVELMQDLLKECEELAGVEMDPVAFKHEELERFYRSLR